MKLRWLKVKHRTTAEEVLRYVAQCDLSISEAKRELEKGEPVRLQFFDDGEWHDVPTVVEEPKQYK